MGKSTLYSRMDIYVMCFSKYTFPPQKVYRLLQTELFYNRGVPVQTCATGGWSIESIDL